MFWVKYIINVQKMQQISWEMMKIYPLKICEIRY